VFIKARLRSEILKRAHFTTLKNNVEIAVAPPTIRLVLAYQLHYTPSA